MISAMVIRMTAKLTVRLRIEMRVRLLRIATGSAVSSVWRSSPAATPLTSE